MGADRTGDPAGQARRPAAQGRCSRSANAIFYVLSTGCQWRALPKDLVPKSMAHAYFMLWGVGRLAGAHSSCALRGDARYGTFAPVAVTAGQQGHARKQTLKMVRKSIVLHVIGFLCSILIAAFSRRWRRRPRQRIRNPRRPPSSILPEIVFGRDTNQNKLSLPNEKFTLALCCTGG